MNGTTLTLRCYTDEFPECKIENKCSNTFTIQHVFEYVSDKTFMFNDKVSNIVIQQKNLT